MEIMAPAGNFECLMAAIEGGADSVYFGVGNLNMRSHSANNFQPEDLAEIVRICRQYGVKTYLTLNIVLYQEDIEPAHRALDAAKAAGVDAVIASDMAAIMYCRQIGMEVHISTQLSISNAEALRFYAQFADVVVLARELNLHQVKDIYETIRRDQIKGPAGELVRIEMFAHGALCMAISGKCYLSLQTYGASANRGACYQLCRRGYEVTDLETGNQLNIDNKYIMSPKDLCTIEFMDKIIDAGVKVFKIEGRARSAEYVKRCAQCYSYYQGAKLGEWSDVYGSHATRKKVYCGKVTNWFDRIGVAEIAVESEALTMGAKCMATGATTGVIEFTVNDLRVALKPAEKAEKGVRCSVAIVPENQGVRDGEVEKGDGSDSKSRADADAVLVNADGKIPVRLRRSDKIYIWEPND